MGPLAHTAAPGIILMNVKRIGNRIQAHLSVSEAMNLKITHGPRLKDGIRGAVWRLLTIHALKELDGLRIGWGAIDYVNNEFVVTFGPADPELYPDAIPIPPERKQ
jgi:hypothetical protein